MKKGPTAFGDYSVLLAVVDQGSDRLFNILREGNVPPLGQDFLNHLPVNIREPEIAPRVAKRQLLMI